MGRGWRPLVVGAVIVVAVFLLAQARIFEPSAPAVATGVGDVERGESVFESQGAGCHGEEGRGGAGPTLFETGLDEADVSAAVQQGRGIMPAGIVTGQDQIDVVAYVVSISSPAS